jgi:Uma2 family endonuclease
MATGTAVSVEEYLRTSYKPHCEYVDGRLVPKAMGTKKHAILQTEIAALLRAAFRNYLTSVELTVRISDKKYLIPDITVERRDQSQDPYPVFPVHLCIEILSPDDRLKDALGKCEDYHAWGTLYAWVIDPLTRRAWQYTKGEQPREVEELLAGEIHLPVAELFSAL